MRATLAFMSLVVLGAVIFSPQALSNYSPSWQQKIGPSLQMNNLFTAKKVDILIIMRDQASFRRSPYRMESKQRKGREVVNSLKNVAFGSQQNILKMLQTSNVNYRQYWAMNAIAAFDVPAEMLKTIASRNDVRKLIANPKLRNRIPSPRYVAQGFGAEAAGQNIVSTGATAVWEKGITGEGIVVAGQDTGVQWNHPALIRSYRGSAGGRRMAPDHDYNWHDAIHSGRSNPCGFGTSVPCDDDQHGTHTMGTMVGDDGGNNKVGMAPGAQWVACRNMDSGYGRPSTYIECFEWFMAPYKKGQTSLQGDPSKAPHVINNSWGCPASEGCEGREMRPVLEALKAAGIMVVVSAGNAGSGCGSINDQPATHTDVTFTVGAHNHRDGNIAGFSSRGPSVIDGGIGPDVTAPGVSVRSTIPGDGYGEAMWSGTSMAGPHVAGAVALLWSAQPKLVGQIDMTIKILTETATAKTSSQTCGGTSGSNIPNNTYGFGHLNIAKAVERALSL